MDEKDFYRFRKSIEQEREFDFDESAWEALSRGMDEVEKPARRPFGFWWLLTAVAVSILLLGNAVLFTKLRETARIQEGLQSQIGLLSQIQRDTIWREKIIYVPDTIIQEKVVYQQIPFVPEKYQQLEALCTADELTSLLAGKLSGRLLPPTEKSLLTDVAAPKKADNQKLETPADGFSLVAIPDLLPRSKGPGLLRSLYPIEPLWSDYLPAVHHQKNKVPFLLKVKQALLPDRLAMGTTLGGLAPFSKDLEQAGGWTTGLTGALQFSRHLLLQLSANYARINYISNEMDPVLGIPVIPSPADQFVFNRAKVVQNALHFNIGLKYYVNVTHKIQPFFYLGYGVASSLPYNIAYDFKNQDLELQVEKQSGNTYLIKNLGLAGTGLSLAFNRHFQFSLEGLYQTQGYKSVGLNADILALKTQLTYQF